LNVSVMTGNIIEVKGVQRLDQFRKVIMYEAARQKFFFDLASEVRQKVCKDLEIIDFDATSIFESTASKILLKAFSEGSSKVVCIVVKRFSGFIGKENEFHARLGKELGGIAKSYGLGGVFHSDELPNYGITKEEVHAVRASFALNEKDAFVLVAGRSQKVRNAADALISRLRNVTEGVPAETRAASIDGETTFLRPRPGSARMYPETDIPLIVVSNDLLSRLRKLVPEPWEKLVQDFANVYDLPAQLAEPLYDSDRRELFEKVIKETQLPTTLVASLLVDTFLALSRSGVVVEALKDDRMFEVFTALKRGDFAKEAVPEILREMAASPGASLDELLRKKGISAINREELERIVSELLAQNHELIRQKGVDGARSTLMGKVMQKVRGKADGKEVSEVLAAQLASLK